MFNKTKKENAALREEMETLKETQNKLEKEKASLADELAALKKSYEALTSEKEGLSKKYDFIVKEYNDEREKHSDKVEEDKKIVDTLRMRNEGLDVMLKKANEELSHYQEFAKKIINFSKLVSDKLNSNAVKGIKETCEKFEFHIKKKK